MVFELAAFPCSFLRNRLVIHLMFSLLLPVFMSFLYLLFVGSRVTILAFFAATTQGGKIYIWIVLLGHCLLMSLFFRPQKDQLGSRDLQGIQKTVTDQNRGRDASSTAGSNVQDENSSSGGCCSCYCAVPKCVSHLLKRYVQTLQRPNLKGNFTCFVLDKK